MKLRHKIFLVLLLTSLSATIITAIIYFKARSALFQQIVAHLQTTAELQEERLSAIADRNKERLRSITARDELKNEIHRHFSTGEKTPLYNLSRELRDIQISVPSFERIDIADTSGLIFASTDSHFVSRKVNHEPFSAAREKNVINYLFLNGNNDLYFHLAGPLKIGKNTAAVVLIKLPANQLSEAINDYTGLGRTGESVLGTKRPNGDAVFVTGVRKDKNAALRRVIPAAQQSPVNLAIEKKEALWTDQVDYDKDPVIAVTKYVEILEMGLVTKIDKDEALQPIMHLKSLFLLLVIISLIISFILSYYFARTITDPILELASHATKVLEDKEFEAVTIHTTDEIGTLGQAFNKMTENLLQANSRQLEALDEVQKANAEIQKANTSLTEFAHIVSHDLKAPLRAIKTLSGWVLSDTENSLSEESKENLRLMNERVSRMNELINGILSYSKAGQEKIPKEPVNVNQLVKDVIKDISIPENIDLKVANKMPVVFFPKIHLQQVFQNLIDNAIKYMDKPEGKISVGYSGEINGYHQFYVQDNGPGIPEKYLEKVFNMFQSGHSGSNVESSGVGLAVVRKVLKVNGGNIWVESEMGNGSAFYFTIPVADDQS